MRIETVKKAIGIILILALLTGFTLVLSHMGGGLLFPLIVYIGTAIVTGFVWVIFWLFDIHN